MTRDEVMRSNYEAEIGITEARRAHIRTQIQLLEAELKQNTARLKEIEYAYGDYLNQVSQQLPVTADQTPEAKTKASKKVS